jgi:hypothetical protein
MRFPRGNRPPMMAKHASAAVLAVPLRYNA